jgi:hypothetical protein
VVGAKVRINTPDEKWCHGIEGTVVRPSSSGGLWWIDLANRTAEDNPYEFDQNEFTVIEEPTA